MRTIVAGVTVLAAFLLCVVTVGATLGATNAIVDPTTIDLTVGELVGSHEYRLRDTHGARSAALTVYREEALDADGTHVGVVIARCLSWGANWTCEGIAKVKDGTYTDAGTITFEGIFRGFNGEQLAVTGGTGAYDNVRGSVTQHTQGDDLVRSFDLLP